MGLPSLRFVQHGIGRCEDQRGGDLCALYFLQVRWDLAHRHASGIKGQNLDIKPRPPVLVLGHNLRFKAAASVAGILDGQFAKFALERFTAHAVSGVALGVGDGLVLAVSKVLSHLGFKGTFNQSFGQLLEKPVFSDEVFRFFVIHQQAVYQFVAYGHFSSFENFGSFLPLNRLHEI
jgi:hypothetical protein